MEIKSFTIEKVSDHIHDDLAFFILSKVPLKSLKRFSCVRKSWSLLFENPNFMNMYRNNFITSNCSSFKDAAIFLLVQETPQQITRNVSYSLSGERCENKVKLDWPPPFQGNDNITFILGPAINGIVCLYQGWTPNVLLWNPTIEEFKVIPHSPTHSPEKIYKDEIFCYHGFGYDLVRDDYNVIQYVHYRLDLPNTDDMEGKPVDLPRNDTWEIYSLRSNSWKKLDLDMPQCHYGVSGFFVYLNGMCHWWIENEDEAYMVSFDLSNEVFCTTPFPSDMKNSFDNSVFVIRHLMVLNESITLIRNYHEKTIFHISILVELCVKESWTKLFIIGPIPGIEHPIGEAKYGDYFFFRRKDDKVVLFDYNTQMIEELGLKGDAYFCQTLIYKESLLPIRRIYD